MREARSCGLLDACQDRRQREDDFVFLAVRWYRRHSSRVREMGKLREDGSGVESRVRGGKRVNRYPVVIMVFMGVVAVTTFISFQTPLGFNQTYSEEKFYEKDSLSGSRKALQRGEEEKPADPYTPFRPDPESSSGWLKTWVTSLPGVVKDESFYCERSHLRTDVCRMHGNVQLVGNASLLLNAVEDKTPVVEETIRPYTRKWEKSCMDNVGELTLRSELVAEGNTSWVCKVTHKVPAVVFSTGGYTGNVYHEFNDGLIPLYITARHLKGDVVFAIVDYQDWWMVRYKEVVRKLSKYDIIDIAANYTQSHCFSDVTAGLFIHEELGIDRSLMPNHESIQDFRDLLNEAYPLENHEWEAEFPTYGSIEQAASTEPGAVPQLVIIKREGSRSIINLAQIIELATRMGFNVTILQPDPTTEMKKIFWLLDRCDVLIGVHGAALTHFLFMRPGSVFIQIVPLGTDWAARTYYGDPARRLGLHYFQYKITVEESSLSNEYERTHPVLVNPNAVTQKGWSVLKEIYLTRQKVELSLPRFYRTLDEAKAKWKADPAPPSQNVLRSRRPHKNHRNPSAGVQSSQRHGPNKRLSENFLSSDQRHNSKDDSKMFLM